MHYKEIILVASILSIFGNREADAQTVTDIDSNVYKTVTIGTQTWFAENLKTTRYNNGDLIDTTLSSRTDIRSEKTPKYQWAYEGKVKNVITYGRLYTWYAATDSRNICPDGWHVPSDADWHTLLMYLDPLASFNSTESASAGGKMKEREKTHWISPNKGATNTSGFTALPGGYRYAGGTFHVNLFSGDWWSSTESSETDAYYWYLSFSFSNIYRISLYKGSGFSVRCLSDN
jgi:uncharacterized protein (TIGR02145 family)